MTSPSSTPLVKVKPLVWVKRTESLDSFKTWDAHPFANPFLRYTIKQLGTGGVFALISPFSVEGSRHSTLSVAQAAAQLEWDRFVRSAIEP